MTNTPGSGWPAGPPPHNGGQPHPGWPHGQPPGAAPYGAGPGYPGGPPPGNGYPATAYPPGVGPAPYGQPVQGQPGHDSGFDPRQALGDQPPPSVSINQFAPPPNRTPLLITVVALVILGLVLAGGMYVNSLPKNQPSASPSPSATEPTGPGHPFTTTDGRTGRWEILDSTWTSEGLQLQVAVYSDEGSISFSFLAFSNGPAEVVRPTSSPKSPDLRIGTATPGAGATGYVFFPMDRGDATIILANGVGRQMSALPVKG